LDFSASINPLGPSLRVISAIQQQLSAIDRYPTPGYEPLCRMLGELHQVPSDWVLPGNGAAELLTWAGRALAELPTTILPVPAFNDYDRALAASGAVVDRRSLINAAGELTTLPDLLTDAPSGWGLLCNNPHNPTGQIFDPAILPDLLDRFGLVIIDESFMDFVRPECSAIPLVDHYPNLLVIRSLTKFYSLPGLRLGYAIGHPDRLQQWQSWRDPWAVNSLAVAAASAAVTDREFIAATHRWYGSSQPLLHGGLCQIPNLQVYPSSANFFLLRSLQMAFPTIQQRLLQEHRIFVRDCLSFPELGAAYGRVAVKRPIENQRLLVALQQVCAARSVNSIEP
jgi:histidinol-phosphate/aromatic aminotransferase/cobyric acid decarboxylase-like protein